MDFLATIPWYILLAVHCVFMGINTALLNRVINADPKAWKNKAGGCVSLILILSGPFGTLIILGYWLVYKIFK